jgi:hypothetical protein
MRWVRSRQHFGSWCALFALAIQLVLSFGHVHVPKIGANPAPATGVLASLAASVDKAAEPSAPLKQKAPNLADDFCAICSLIHLASSILPAAAPGLPLPLLAKEVEVATRLEIARAPVPSLLFQARAPPQV